MRPVTRSRARRGRRRGRGRGRPPSGGHGRSGRRDRSEFMPPASRAPAARDIGDTPEPDPEPKGALPHSCKGQPFMFRGWRSSRSGRASSRRWSGCSAVGRAAADRGAAGDRQDAAARGGARAGGRAARAERARVGARARLPVRGRAAAARAGGARRALRRAPPRSPQPVLRGVGGEQDAGSALHGLYWLTANLAAAQPAAGAGRRHPLGRPRRRCAGSPTSRSVSTGSRSRLVAAARPAEAGEGQPVLDDLAHNPSSRCSSRAG